MYVCAVLGACALYIGDGWREEAARGGVMTGPIESIHKGPLNFKKPVHFQYLLLLER
jgi:hypothetical protein